MFTLATIQDTIRLAPNTFHLPHGKALSQEINRKYSNRIIPDVGLGISLYDVKSASDGLLKSGDGAIYIKTEFRLVIFAPFDGEVLVGWISSCKPEGIKVRMEFFDDIFIPKSMLFEGCHFIVKEQAWVWKQDDYELYLDINEKVRFRVEQSKYENSGFQIIGSCQVDGMGLLSWW